MRRVHGARLRKELEDKLNSEDHVAITLGGPDGVPGYGQRDASGGFDVTVEGVAISGPLETAGEIRAAMEHDWRSADIGGDCSGGALSYHNGGFVGRIKSTVLWCDLVVAASASPIDA